MAVLSSNQLPKTSTKSASSENRADSILMSWRFQESTNAFMTPRTAASSSVAIFLLARSQPDPINRRLLRQCDIGPSTSPPHRGGRGGGEWQFLIAKLAI